MIEATCGACGTINRIAEADVPAGAKFATCSSGKSGGAIAGPTAKPPPIPVPVPGKREGVIDLADLPAPKRSSPLAGVEGGAKPGPKSALSEIDLPAPKLPARPTSAAPLDLDEIMPADLPAPKTKPDPAATSRGPLPGKLPARPEGIVDLPAPKAKPTTGATPTLPRLTGVADLPAPKSATPSVIADLPTPKGVPD